MGCTYFCVYFIFVVSLIWGVWGAAVGCWLVSQCWQLDVAFSISILQLLFPCVQSHRFRQEHRQARWLYQVTQNIVNIFIHMSLLDACDCRAILSNDKFESLGKIFPKSKEYISYTSYASHFLVFIILPTIHYKHLPHLAKENFIFWETSFSESPFTPSWLVTWFPSTPRKYIPQLAKYPENYIYEPWKAPLSVQKAAGCIIGQDYPRPVVDHSIVMKRNLERMGQAYRAGETSGHVWTCHAWSSKLFFDLPNVWMRAKVKWNPLKVLVCLQKSESNGRVCILFSSPGVWRRQHFDDKRQHDLGNWYCLYIMCWHLSYHIE